MRQQLVWITFAGLAVLLSVSADPAVAEKSTRASGNVAVREKTLSFPVVRDELAMLLIGSALIAVAAVVRRSA